MMISMGTAPHSASIDTARPRSTVLEHILRATRCLYIVSEKVYAQFRRMQIWWRSSHCLTVHKANSVEIPLKALLAPVKTSWNNGKAHCHWYEQYTFVYAAMMIQFISEDNRHNSQHTHCQLGSLPSAISRSHLLHYIHSQKTTVITRTTHIVT